jgi:hypothetical protein
VCAADLPGDAVNFLVLHKFLLGSACAVCSRFAGKLFRLGMEIWLVALAGQCVRWRKRANYMGGDMVEESFVGLIGIVESSVRGERRWKVPSWGI